MVIMRTTDKKGRPVRKGGKIFEHLNLKQDEKSDREKWSDASPQALNEIQSQRMTDNELDDLINELNN